MLGLEIVIFLVIGGIVGWLASLFVKGESFGVVADIAIGVLGGLIGGWLVTALGIGGGILAAIIAGAAGAIDLICIMRVVKLQAASA